MSTDIDVSKLRNYCGEHREQWEAAHPEAQGYRSVLEAPPMQQAYAEQVDGLRECPRHPGVEMVRVSIGVMHLDGSPSEPLVGWACARCNRGRSFVVER